ncbi:MAG: hypothetical protein U0794_15385, partial [Isosphaeraceae bacterium]
MMRSVDRPDGASGGQGGWCRQVRRSASPILWLVLSAWVLGGEAAPSRPSPTAPTFTKDVAPILQKRCQNCHRPGEVGPFALQSYEHARKRATDIATVAGERSMPPWMPAPGVGVKLKDDHSLTHGEIKTLERWAEAGAPRGDEKHLPPATKYPEGWSLGTPDLILETAEPFSIPASGPDTYRCFVIPTRLTRDTYISAVEFRPGNRRVVHHMSSFLDTSGGGRKRDAEEPGPGYISFNGPGVDVSTDLGGWTPGNVPRHLPEGIGRLVPAGSDIILQVHYHPTGKPEVDRTRIGLYFRKTPVKQTLHWANASSYNFRLPPGEKNIEVKATWFVPVDLEALAITPHMHALGKDFRMSVTYPNGKTRDLLHIASWDPAWQDTYNFAEKVSLPKGSTVRLLAHFDNSAHPRNPHKPPKLVKWGHSAGDEMCVGYIGVVKAKQDLTNPAERDDLFDIL